MQTRGIETRLNSAFNSLSQQSKCVKDVRLHFRNVEHCVSVFVYEIKQDNMSGCFFFFFLLPVKMTFTFLETGLEMNGFGKSATKIIKIPT